MSHHTTDLFLYFVRVLEGAEKRCHLVKMRRQVRKCFYVSFQRAWTKVFSCLIWRTCCHIVTLVCWIHELSNNNMQDTTTLFCLSAYQPHVHGDIYVIGTSDWLFTQGTEYHSSFQWKLLTGCLHQNTSCYLFSASKHFKKPKGSNSNNKELLWGVFDAYKIVFIIL